MLLSSAFADTGAVQLGLCSHVLPLLRHLLLGHLTRFVDVRFRNHATPNP